MLLNKPPTQRAEVEKCVRCFFLDVAAVVQKLLNVLECTRHSRCNQLTASGTLLSSCVANLKCCAFFERPNSMSLHTTNQHTSTSSEANALSLPILQCRRQIILKTFYTRWMLPQTPYANGGA